MIKKYLLGIQQTDMSGFSAELIDYLEGRISFEEFDKRRDERKAKVRRAAALKSRAKLANSVCHFTCN